MACGKKCYRDTIIATCFSACDRKTRRIMHTGSGHVVDWKWEYMEKRLIGLQTRVPLLLRYYDYQKVKVTQDPLWAAVDIALQFPELMPCISGLASICVAVGKWGRWLSGCRCHEEMMKFCDVRQRMTAFRKAGFAQGACPWMGRRGCELAFGEIDTMVADIRKAQTFEFKVVGQSMLKQV